MRNALALGAVLLLAAHTTGCGGHSAKSPEDMAVASDLATGDQGAPGDLAAGVDLTVNADLTPVVGTDGGLLGACTASQPCLAGGANGLCVSGACVACNDPADDQACANVYGSGTLCLSGSCTAATCRTPTDCGGQLCVGHQCTPCGSDSDCGAGMVCNTNSGGLCVANVAQCSGTAQGACPVNGFDKCCNDGNTTCQAVECCITADCGGGGLVCVTGHCQASGCPTTNASTTLYVDATTPSPGPGTQQCPYRSIASALAAASSGYTVVVKGGEVISASNERIIGDGVTVTGGTSPAPSPGPFNACDPTACADSDNWPTIRVSNDKHFGFQMPGAGSALRYFNVVGPSPSPNSHYGVYVPSPAPDAATLDHLRVSHWHLGIMAEQGASVSIGVDVQSINNSDGLVCQGDSTCTINNAAVGSPKTLFSNNRVDGIISAGTLSAIGPNHDPLLLRADANGRYGIVWVPPAGSSATASLQRVAMSANGVTQSGAGLLIDAQAPLVMRNCSLLNNIGYGVGVVQPSATALTQIDFGTAGQPGGNTIQSNTLSGICIGAGGSKEAIPGSSVTAVGNTFGTTGTPNACTSANSTLIFGSDCAAGADVGWVNCPASGACDCGDDFINASTCSYSIGAASGHTCAM